MSNAAKSTPPRIVAGRSSVVMTGPPGENRWGFYQFPDMWRAPRGEIYCAVNVGFDTMLDAHEPSRFFVSRDDGATWTQIEHAKMDRAPEVFTFSDGSQVSFGDSRFIYHAHNFGPLTEDWQWWDIGKMGLKPIADTLLPDSYGAYHYQIFRAPDIPAEHRTFSRRYRKSPKDPWQEDVATWQASSEVGIGGLARPGWYDESGKRFFEDISPRAYRFWPKWGQYDLQILPDDTLLWAQFYTHPRSYEKKHCIYAVVLFESTDKGKTWRQRSLLADDLNATTDGYSGDEHALAIMPNGDLYCVMRTVMGDQKGCTMYLAATRSRDQGRTWTRPPFEIAPFSVTPLMMTLKNGCIALAYGRPGVYVRASSDNAATWSDALPVVGPTESELLKDRWWDVKYHRHSTDKISCGNLGAVVTGPDRFLLAYTDFRHRNDKGEQCKVVKTQEFVVSR